MIGAIFTGFYGDHGRYISAPPANAHRLRTFLADHGFAIRVFNFAPYWTPDEMVEALARLPNLRFVGFTTTFEKSLAHIRPAARRIREALPHIRIIVGGPEIVFEASDDTLFDRAFLGYSEIALLRYCESLTGGPDLDWRQSPFGIPMVVADEQYPLKDCSDLRIDWLPEDGITAHTALPIEISRGCAFRCKFCSYPLMGKTRFDHIRSEESLAAEFRRNFELFGTTRYQFLDDTFNDSVHKLDLVHRAIMASGVPVRFVTYLRHDLLASFPHTIEKLAHMGLLGAMLGIESLDERVRKSIGKGSTNATMLATLRSLKGMRRDLWVSSGFIVGLPFDTRKTLEGSHRFLLSQDHRYLDFWHWQSLYINRHATRLTTVFGREASKYGYTFESDGPEWSSPIMTYRDAIEIAKGFQRESAAFIRPSAVMINEMLGTGIEINDLVGRTKRDLQHIDLPAHVIALADHHKRAALS